MRFSDNRAAGPPRPWSASEVDVYEASALIDKLPTPGRELLSQLAGLPDVWLDASDLANELTANRDVEAVRSAVRRVIQFCDAFGKVPLLEFREDAVRVRADHVPVIVSAISLRDR